MISEEYWNYLLKKINATSSDDSDAESGNLFSQSKLYFSQTHRGWMCKICEKYQSSGGSSKRAFSTTAGENTTHPSHAFRQHERSQRHIRLEKKTIGFGSADALAVSKAQNINRQYVNKLHLRKCIDSKFVMIRKHWPLADNYGDLLNFLANRIQEPITKQYLNSCPKNITYLSNTTVEPLLDAMNFYYESENLNERRDAPFVCLYDDEAENSSHRECFAMFLTYYSVSDRQVKTCFLGILNLNGQEATQITNTLKMFFGAKQIILERVLFSVLDGTNTMSGKVGGLQRRIQHYSPFNVYANCRNHCLALCLPCNIKNKKSSNMLADCDALLLGLWKMFQYSPKKGSILGLIQQIYGKKPLKILKAATTRWLTHGKSSVRVLECFRELLLTVDQICSDTNESEGRGYGRIIMRHKLTNFACA